MGGGMNEIGGRIRELRHRSGLTQEELAARSSLSERSLRDLESGRVTKPRAKSIRLIASALELSTEDTRHLLALITDDTPPPAASRPIARLNQLPVADQHFTGRFTELRELDGLLSDQRIVVISAFGGSGKTALAVHWAHGASAQFPDGQLYVDLLGFTPGQTPLEPTEALGRILTALEVKPAEQPGTLAERAALYRSLVNGRRLLVVLDNAATAEQVRPLLPGSGSCATIVTSRERLAGLVVREGAHPLLLEAMTESEAGELLRGILGAPAVDADRAAAAEIIALCGRLPLAIRVVGASVALGNHSSLRVAADELASADRLERLSLPEDPASSVLPAFQTSYAPLPDDLKLLFGRLGLLPGTSFGVAVVASLMASTVVDVERQFRRLVDLNLVQSDGRGRFALHDLVKLFAQRCGGPDDAALARGLDYYLQSADAANHLLRPSRVRQPIDPPLDGVIIEEFGTSDAALRWCIDEIATIADAVELATSSGQYRPAVQLPTSMIDFFQTRKHWSAWLGTHRRGVETARSLGDKEREGVLLQGIGAAHRELRQYDLAQDHLDAAAEIARAGNHRFPLARALSALGILAMDQGDNDTAVVRFAECAQIAEEDDDPYGAMLAVYNSGYANLLSDKLDEARVAFEKALAMSQKLQADEISTGCGGALAEIMRLTGDPEGALVRFREGVAHAVEANNLIGQVAGNDAIAKTLIQLGRPAEAKSAYQLAVKAAEELGDPRLPELQAALEKLG